MYAHKHTRQDGARTPSRVVYVNVITLSLLLSPFHSLSFYSRIYDARAVRSFTESRRHTTYTPTHESAATARSRDCTHRRRPNATTNVEEFTRDAFRSGGSREPSSGGRGELIAASVFLSLCLTDRRVLIQFWWKNWGKKNQNIVLIYCYLKHILFTKWKKSMFIYRLIYKEKIVRYAYLWIIIADITLYGERKLYIL